MDGIKQQDSTPQNDSTLGFKWIKKIKSDSEFLSHNLMLNSGEKKFALCVTKIKKILTLV
jgi:hypothetical protein